MERERVKFSDYANRIIQTAERTCFNYHDHHATTSTFDPQVLLIGEIHPQINSLTEEIDHKRTLKVPQNRKDTRTIINAASVDNLVILLEGYSENSLSTPREYFLLGFEDKIKYNDNEQVVEDLHKIRDNWNNGEDPEKRQKRIEYLVNLRSLNFAQSIIENVNRGHKIVQLVGAYHVPFIERHLKKNNVSYLSFIQDQKTNAQNKMVNLNHL